MKKIILMFAFLGAFAIAGANAQCNKGGAEKTGAACCSKKSSEAAIKAAANDKTIEMRKAENGEVSFVRKANSKDGAVSFQEVCYNEAEGKFVNVPVAHGDKAACGSHAEKAGAACCAKKADGSGASLNTDKKVKVVKAAINN